VYREGTEIAGWDEAGLEVGDEVFEVERLRAAKHEQGHVVVARQVRLRVVVS
jgi:hypothetical protein